MKLDKQSYRQFCQTEKSLPIFFQDWYLDATCSTDNWDVIIIEKSGEISAILPYYHKSKYGFTYITMPPLTKFMGPYIIDKYRHKTISIYKELIKQLPKTSYYLQNFNYQVENWLPFYWNNYKQTTRYCHIVSDFKDRDNYFKSLDRYYKKKILQGDDLLSIVYEDTVCDYISASFNLVSKTFERQGIRVPFSESVYENLLLVLSEKKCLKVFFAINDQGIPIATAILVWDSHSAYYLISGEDPVYRDQSAGIYLTYKMIRYTSDVLRIDRFDFLGSMIPNLEVIRRKFNAVPTPYFEIEKYHSKIFRFISILKNTIK